MTTRVHYIPGEGGLTRVETEVDELLEACVELLTVARVRRDSEIPHEMHDLRPWNYLMKGAWKKLTELVESAAPGRVDEEIRALKARGRGF